MQLFVFMLAVIVTLHVTHGRPPNGGRCDIAREEMSECGYYGIEELECIERGCCWRPCHGCDSVPWCFKSREMYRAECLQDPEEKRDCGYYGIQREDCLQRGCCWMPSDQPNDPWCYFQATGNLESETSTTGLQYTTPHFTSHPQEPGNEGDLRLADKDPNGIGRLEIYHDGQWGTICDDLFSGDAIKVACRQLGFSVEDNVFIGLHSSTYSGSSPIMLDDVQCTGNEISLDSCDHRPFYSNDCGHSEDVHLSCVSAEVGLRLNSSGRLEISFNGQWGTVCDDGFDNTAAQLACKTLGYDGYSATILTSKPDQTAEDLPILWDNTNCAVFSSPDNFFSCGHTSPGHHDCSHSEDVYLSCDSVTTPTYAYEDGNEGDLRLADKDPNGIGRLEIYHAGRWGTICDDYFNMDAIKVACRQLGFMFEDNVVIDLHPSTYSGSAPIMLDDVTCTGNEISLDSCDHQPYYTHNCGHAEDVHLSCETTEVDLRLSSSGRLEVSFNGQWGTVCDDGFDNTAAQLACKTLGYDGYSATILTSRPNQTDEDLPILWDNTNCAATDSSFNFFNCGHLPIGEHDCSHLEHVYLSCDAVTTPTYTYEAGNEGDLRLADKDSNGIGRLEIYHDGRWGTVCDDAFDQDARKVACRQLGFSVGDSNFIELHSNKAYSVSSPIMLDEVRCTGNETSLDSCSHDPYFTNNCDHSEDVHLSCVPIKVDLRLSSSGRLEIFYDGQWGTVCKDGFESAAAEIACRTLGYDNFQVAYPGHTDDQTVEDLPILWDDTNCATSNPPDFFNCVHAPIGEHDCSHSGDVYLSCATQNTTEAGSEGELRLADTNANGIGRLEVYHDGEWGTICDDGFDWKTRIVACRQLGFSLDDNAIIDIYKGDTFALASKIMLDDVKCTGNETSLDSCNHVPYYTSDCTHTEDVHLSCVPVKVDLRLSSSGRLEIYHQGVWGTVCDDSFDNTAAQVACRTLGYDGNFTILTPAADQISDDLPILWDSTSCDASDPPHFFFCGHAPIGEHDCSHSEDVYLSCDPAEA